MQSVATKQITKTRNAHWRDYLELTKPRVVALLLLTAVVGMYLATEQLVSLSVLVPALTGIGLMSAAAAAVNHLVDRHIDAKMARTLRRPLPLLLPRLPSSLIPTQNPTRSLTQNPI